MNTQTRQASRWIFFDVDGTLTRAVEAGLTSAVLETFDALGNRGWHVALATARRVGALRRWGEPLGLLRPYVALDGAQVGDARADGRQSTCGETFDTPALQQVDRIAKSRDIEAVYYLGGAGGVEALLTPASWTGYKRLLQADRGLALTTNASAQLNNVIATRVTADRHEELSELRQAIRSLGLWTGPVHSLGEGSAKWWSFLVHSAPTNKLRGAQRLAELLGSTLTCFCVAGDDVNDVELFGTCDVGFVLPGARVGVAGAHMHDFPQSLPSWASFPELLERSWLCAHEGRLDTDSDGAKGIRFHGLR